MPEQVKWSGNSHLVATEKELLRFANRIRKAGGATILNELLPSTMSVPRACLIATAVNFESEVNTWQPAGSAVDVETQWPSGDHMWVMVPYRGNAENSDKLTVELGEKLGLKVVETKAYADNEDYEDTIYMRKALLLPEPIGNAAHAFDIGERFEQYADN